MTPTELRELLASAGLSQRAAAYRLGINERKFRRYCAGQADIPLAVVMALRYMLQESRPH